MIKNPLKTVVGFCTLPLKSYIQIQNINFYLKIIRNANTITGKTVFPTMDEYKSILSELRKKGYISDKDLDTVIRYSSKNGRLSLENIKKEKSEIIRKAIFEKNRSSR